MPMTLADAEREISVLKNITAGLMRSNATLTTRIEALEKREVNLERLVDAAEDIAKAQHGPFGGTP